MPRNTKCFLTEDNELLRETTKGYLEEGGHTVVAEAANVHTALELVPQLQALGVTVAVLDGNLDDPNDGSGNDGRRIAAAIRALGVGIHIVCVSLKTNYKWPDCSVSKYDMADLAETINRLK